MSFNEELAVWGTPPRLGGRFGKTTGSATIIINVDITIPLPPRVPVNSGRPQGRVSSYYGDFGLQEARMHMMTDGMMPMVTNMIGLDAVT